MRGVTRGAGEISTFSSLGMGAVSSRFAGTSSPWVVARQANGLLVPQQHGWPISCMRIVTGGAVSTTCRDVRGGRFARSHYLVCMTFAAQPIL